MGVYKSLIGGLFGFSKYLHGLTRKASRLEEAGKEDQRQDALIQEQGAVISDLLRDKKQQQQQIAEMHVKLELLLRSRQ